MGEGHSGVDLDLPTTFTVMDETPLRPAWWRRTVPSGKGVDDTIFRSIISTEGCQRVLLCLLVAVWSLGCLVQDEIPKEMAPLLAGGSTDRHYFTVLPPEKSLNLRASVRPRQVRETVNKRHREQRMRSDLQIQLPIRDTAGGQQEDWTERGDGKEQAGEAEPEGGSSHLPPPLDIWKVNNARRCPLGLTEHLVVADRQNKIITSDLQEAYLTTHAA